jgi:hypothetical protein
MAIDALEFDQTVVPVGVWAIAGPLLANMLV